MKRIFAIVLASICFAACAGYPPASWIPGNRYGQTAQPAAQTPAPAPSVKKPAEPTEVALDPLPDNSYEEVILPLPEEEDTPAPALVTEPALDSTLPAPSILE